MSSHRNPLSYVLITPVRNGEDFVERTIQSVISQTVLPKKWIIVNDGSTDATEATVLKYTNHCWIELLQMSVHKKHDFSAKARCFNAAFERLKQMEFDVVANVDADVSFDEGYFAFLLEKFVQFPALGVAGTPMKEGNSDAVDDGLFNETDVFGACQLFRRECLEAIGGYAPIKGGIDWVAVRMARMKGWETRSFLEKRFFHHRVMGATESSAWRSFVKYGKKDYFLGNHPLWELFRIAYQMTRRPLIVKGLLLFIGYAWAYVTRMERPVSLDLIEFHRREQLQRLKSTLGGRLLPQGPE
jgi:poly-beta-1,6-N-acetyl-D-glucosamine synthase